MNMRAVFLAGSILALAACADEAVDAPAETASVETPIPVEPDGGIGDGAGPPDEVEQALANRIPTRFHGVWDFVDGTCARESDLRLEISGAEIMFYESIGTVLSADENEATTLVNLAMEGEGETWQDTYSLTITDDEQLLLEYVTDGVSPVPIPRKRCP